MTAPELSKALHRETPSPSKRIERRLWFGILAGPFAWTAHELIGLAIVGRRCMDDADMDPLGYWLLFGIGLAAAAITAAGAWVAFRVFREWTDQKKLTRAEGWDRVEFMAIAGVIISIALLANIILMAVMPAIVNPCMVTT